MVHGKERNADYSVSPQAHQCMLMDVSETFSHDWCNSNKSFHMFLKFPLNLLGVKKLLNWTYFQTVPLQYLLAFRKL